jgi:EAL domain-containing protein (putative c-di-GMP-specific phosphodiesterase class I)
VFENPDFVPAVRRYLPREERFPGLIFELTEEEVIRDPDYAHEIATQLKLYRIDVSIDDFGSGHSTIERLHQLPFAELKIDRRYVQGCAREHHRYGLCRSIVDLAHRFEMAVVAEGVENARDCAALVEMACDGAQGFLFARPMERENFITTLLSRVVRRQPPAKPRFGSAGIAEMCA